jgi:PAS domain S-box-containing protein
MPDLEPEDDLLFRPEWSRAALSQIGDAVITTDKDGQVTFLNPVAQELTGWTQEEAVGVSVEEVFRIVHPETRTTVESPAARALRQGVNVGLANRTLLIARDGRELPIGPSADSAVPIRNGKGELAGAVLVFRDITEICRQERAVQVALAYADSIISTLREPFVVLDGSLRVKTANHTFYDTFHVRKEETEGWLLFELGSGQWDSFRLRTLLEAVLANHCPVHDVELEQDFPTLGTRVMLLNARWFASVENDPGLILLAIEDITERRRAEAALTMRNERLHLLWESAGVLLSATDPDSMLRGLLAKIGPQLGVDTYFNFAMEDGGAALRLVSCEGVSKETAQSLSRLEFCPKLSGNAATVGQPCMAPMLQPCVETRTTIQPCIDAQRRFAQSLGLRAYSCNCLMSDNIQLGTLSFGSRTKDEFDSGDLAFLETISHYVAVAYGKLRSQSLVSGNEKRIRFLLDSIPQKLVTTRPDGCVDYFNRQWMEYTGLPFEQIKDYGWTQFIHPEDVDEHVGKWLQSVQTGDAYEHESRIRNAAGEYRWHVSRGVPIRNEAGQIVMWVGTNTDIHELKLTELALVDSEIRYRRLFETAKDGILILDTESGRISDANPFMGELLGYSHEHFLGKELWEIGLFSDKPGNEAAVRTLRERGYLRYDHLPLETRDGSKVEVEVVANVYQENQQSVIQCNIRDITERSYLESQMQAQAETLADLHRRKDEFLAMLSHELRNPLAPIANAVQLLSLQKHADTLTHQARTIIERQVGQLTRLIDDLLEVSRITTGRIHLQRERVELNGVVARGVETTYPLMKQHRHELTVSVPSEESWVDADPARLEQVVVNLLTNAAKYTADGGAISIVVEREDDEAVLRVRDSGVGIAPELMPHVFDLFTQAERSLDRSQGGLGIGLSLVKRLVELHGGTVEVRSTVGQGSEFVVHLPIERAMPGAAAGSPDLLPGSEGAALRVLVVDDNLDSANSLGLLLEATGQRVQLAHDGPTAIEAALVFQPQVVLLDIGLPGLDGYEVARRIQEQPSLKDVVLVAITGYGNVADLRRSEEAGFKHHLVKPADFKQVVAILASAAEKAGS